LVFFIFTSGETISAASKEALLSLVSIFKKIQVQRSAQQKQRDLLYSLKIGQELKAKQHPTSL
jgi:hypothetical protein